MLKRLSFLLCCALLASMAWVKPLEAQSAGHISTSGSTCALATSCVILPLPSQTAATASINAGGTFTGTLQFETTVDNVTWSAVNCTPASGATVSSTTAAGTWVCPVNGLSFLRVRASALSAGFADMNLQYSSAPLNGAPTAFAGVPSGSCSSTQTAVNTTNGNFYVCNVGTWQLDTGTTAIAGLTGTTQGLAMIGGSSGAANLASPYYTTLFSNSNICQRIKAAITASLAANANRSVMIDASAETGIFICPAADATTMLDGLRTSGNVGGVIKLPCGGGIYADGPGVYANYSDFLGSTLGTPAFTLPAYTHFVGCTVNQTISTKVIGTALGICDGSNIPVTGCTSRFPVRFFTIDTEAFVNTAAQVGSSSSTTTCTPNTTIGANVPKKYCVMFIHVTDGPFTLGGNGNDPNGGQGTATEAVNTVTMTNANGNWSSGFTVGASVTVSGCSVAAYNITAVITAGGSGGTAFTYTDNGITGGGTGNNCLANVQPITLSAANEVSNTVTLTAGSNFPATYVVGYPITVTGCSVAGYNISAPIATGGAGGTTLTYTDSGVTGGGAATGCQVQVVPKLVYTSSGASSGSGEAVGIVNCANCVAAQGNGTQLNQTTPANNAGTYELSVVCTGSGTGNPTKRGSLGTTHGEELLCSNSSQIGIRVPPGTAVCSATCGNLIFSTPALGVDPPSNQSYTAAIANGGNATFGAIIQNIDFDLANAFTAIAIQCYWCQEKTAIENIKITHMSWGGFVDGTTNTQNYGPLKQWEIFANVSQGANNFQCGPHTFGILRKAQGDTRPFDGMTITANDSKCSCTAGGTVGCGSNTNTAPNAARAAILWDSNNSELNNTHCEGFIWCVEAGDNETVQNLLVKNANGQPGGNNAGLGVVHIAPTYAPYDISLQGINVNNAIYNVFDEFNLGLQPAYPVGPFTITSVTLASGNCTFNFASNLAAANNGLAGLPFTGSAFAVAGNNGVQVIDSSTATTAVVNSCSGGADTTGTLTSFAGTVLKDARVLTYSYDMNSLGTNGSRICTSPNCPQQSNYGQSKITTVLPCYSGTSAAVCKSAVSGYVAVPAGANSTLAVNTTAINANSQVLLTPTDEASIGTLLGVTCNSTIAQMFPVFVSARTPGTSFTITVNGTTVTNPLCLSYQIFN